MASAFHQRDLLRHLLIHLVELRDGDREVDEDQQDEEDPDQEEERRGIGDPRGVGDTDEPVLLDREYEDDHASEQPQDGILFAQFAPAHHLQDVEEKGGGDDDGKDGYPAHPNLRMRLIR